jgi:hypothetical protein
MPKRMRKTTVGKFTRLVDDGTDDEIIAWALAVAKSYAIERHRRRRATAETRESHDALAIRIEGILERRGVSS